MINTGRKLWEEIWTPSRRNESAYHWSVIALGHAMLGALIYSVMPGEFWIWVAAYAGLKEAIDLASGGSAADGAVDTAFVASGAFYGAWWWPVAVFGAVGLGLAARSAGRVRW